MCENNDTTFKFMACNEEIQQMVLYKDLLSKLKNKKCLQFFTPNEVVVHNSGNDCWVSFLGLVRDLTPLIQKYINSPSIKPILAFAGKDISNWFDPRTGDVSISVLITNR